jgi:hypothetical protein
MIGGANADSVLNSIVAVHGFQGHREKSWTYDEPNPETASEIPSLSAAPWLYALGEISDVRVFTYGYRAYDTIGFVARDLVRSLDDARLDTRASPTPSSDIPIIFLAHGLGGLVVKQVGSAFLLASLAYL